MLGKGTALSSLALVMLTVDFIRNWITCYTWRPDLDHFEAHYFLALLGHN